MKMRGDSTGLKPGDNLEDTAHKISPDEEPEVRCDCGRLVAMLTPIGVEIKCKRCKKVSIIPLNKMKTNKGK